MSEIILSENSEVKASTIPVSLEKEKEKTMTWREVCSKANDIKYVSQQLYYMYFIFCRFLCYASVVPGKQTNPKRKEASIVKKLEKVFEEFYKKLLTP